VKERRNPLWSEPAVAIELIEERTRLGKACRPHELTLFQRIQVVELHRRGRVDFIL
jgi:hypothetical protein